MTVLKIAKQLNTRPYFLEQKLDSYEQQRAHASELLESMFCFLTMCLIFALSFFSCFSRAILFATFSKTGNLRNLERTKISENFCWLGTE